jgi:hypothetical protein
MFESISRSWELVMASWRILMEDRKLLAFPILSGIVTLLVVASFIIPVFLAGAGMGVFAEPGVLSRGAPSPGTIPAPVGPGIPWVVLLFLFYVVTYAVAIFFNAALVSCVHARFEGRETSLGDGISHAARHLGTILAWALVAATVGVVLRAIGERSGIIGKLAVALVGGVWSLLTIFVVPILVIEDRGVTDAIRGSITLFRRTWGESVVGVVSIGVIFAAIAMVAVIPVVAMALFGGLAGFALALTLFIILVVVLGIISSAMNGIFVTALYHYAQTGAVPPFFGKGVIEQAFVSRAPLTGAGNI